MSPRRRDAGGQQDLFGDDSPGAVPGDPLAAPSPSGLRAGAPFPDGVHVGTCAFQHPDWRGTFYPRGLPPGSELAYYARHLNAVEIDASFYSVPAPALVERWLAQTPPQFLFALKAPRALTHEGRLDIAQPEARAAWEALLGLVPLLGARLGALLLQLPPQATARQADRLGAVLAMAPPGTRLAVEFRHPSWNTPETDALLAGHGAARTWSDGYLDGRLQLDAADPHHFAATGPFVYARLLGDIATKYHAVTGRLRHRYGTVLFDRRDDIEDWLRRVREARRAGKPVLLFINNHYEGFSPLTAERFRSRLMGE